MEEKELEIMIERFFNAELTVEEERVLCRYLCDNDVPAELRKDKEAIIALCGEPVDVQLPVGAAERLEAMLNELATSLDFETERKQAVVKEKRKIVKIPRYLIHSVAVAAMVLIAYLLMPAGETIPLENDMSLIASYETEEDTFDNPEDAMRCMQMAFADVQHAVSATQMSMLEVGALLKNTTKMYK